MFESPTTVVLQSVGPFFVQGLIDMLIKQGQNVTLADYHGGPKISKHPSLSVIWPGGRNIDSLAGQLQPNAENDFVIVNGGELLLDVNKDAVMFTRSYGDLRLHTYHQYHLDWMQLPPLLAACRQAVGDTKLIFILYVEEDVEEAILPLFEEDETVELMFVRPSAESSSVAIQRAILAGIKERPLPEMLAAIDAKREELPEQTVPVLKAYAYLRHGLRSEAIAQLEQAIADLQPDDRMLLAEMHLSAGNAQQAFELSCEVYERAPFTRGTSKMLLRSLLGCSQENSVVHQWINRAVALDCENPEVLDLAANGLNRIGEFGEAIAIRRRLKEITDDPTQDLLVLFLELQRDLPAKIAEAENRVFELVRRHPDLETEARFRLGLLSLRKYDSPYKAFEHWDKVPTTDNPQAYSAAAGRMSLLEDNIVAAKALGLNLANERDQQQLLQLKTKELLRDMEVLSGEELGYTVWGEYIDKAYSAQTWKKQLVKVLHRQVDEWTNTVADSQLSDSYLTRSQQEASHIDDLTPETAFEVLRRLKTQELPRVNSESDADMVLQGALIVAETRGTVVQQIWSRYECSIILSLRGRDQDAIDHALSLFGFANRQDDKPLSRIARMLGFIAWGNVQYRLGHKVEGLAALLVGMRLSMETGELGPFVEDGMNVIYRFILDDDDFPTIPQTMQTALKDFFGKFADRMGSNNSLIQAAFLAGDFRQAYSALRETVYNQDEHDSEWAGHFGNFIAACAQIDHVSEAQRLLLRYAREVARLLSNRKDLLPRLLLSWSQLLLIPHDNDIPVVDCYRLARELLMSAVEISDTRRGLLKYKGERSHLADTHREIAVQYIETLALISKLSDFSPEEQGQALRDLLHALPLVNPRSIMESRMELGDLPEDVVELERERQALLDEIMGLEHNDEYKQQLARRYGSVQQALKERHPNYRPLPLLEGYSVIDYQHVLKENEIFVQYVVTRLGMVTLVLGRTAHTVDLALMPSQQYRGRVAAVGQILQGSQVRTADELLQIRQLCTNLSEPIVKAIRRFLEETGETRLDALYLCPDLTLSMFSANLLATEEGWLVEKLNRISTLLDVSQLLERDEYASKGKSRLTLVGSLGSSGDKAVNAARAKLKTWAHRPELSHLDLSNNGHEVAALAQHSKSLTPNTVVVIGHGIPDTRAGELSGATGILGYKHTIWSDELSKLSELADHLVLITCSGGSPYEHQIESSTGVWNGILSKDFFGVVLCRWDVNVHATLALLDEMLALRERDPLLPLSAALCSAQRSLLHTKDWAHPVFWAGLEYWGL